MRSTLQQPTQRIFALVSLSRSLIPALFAFVLALASFAVHAQQNPPSDPDTDPNPDVPREEPVVPVTMSASVSPTSIAAYTGTATLSWSSLNAYECEYDGAQKSVSGSESVGSYSTSGTKSLVVSCTGNGEGNSVETTVDLTVTRAPPPVITTDLSATVLEADVDTVTVEFSAQYADYCTYAGVEYPTSGEATLGPYAAGEHRLTFSCSGDGGESPHTISWEVFDLVSITASVPPGSISANDSDTVRVSWNAPAADDCSIGNTEYEKEDHEDFGPYSYSQAGSKSATVTCENALDSASSTVTWEVEALDLPGAPRNLRFSENPSDDGSSVLRWDAPSSGATPTGYVVNLQGSSSNPLSKGFSSRRLSISGLSNGSYTYEVHACIGTATVPVCGGSDSITLDVDIPPGAPRNLRSSENPSTDGSFVLTWNAPSGTPTAAGYVVNLRGSTSGPLSKTYSARRLSISGLSNGSYTYEVQACSGTASEPNCGAAATVTVTVERVDPVPGAPRNLRSSEETSLDGSFDLSWDAPSGTPAATGYLVNLLGSTSGPLSKTYSARRLSISGLSNGSYTYEVQACTGTASAPNCGAAAAVTVTVNIPGTVTATAELDPDSIPVNSGTSVLTWGSTNATSCTLNGAALTGTGGTRTLGPYTTVGEQMFTVACTGTGDATASASATLNVVDPTGQEPTISITLSKTTVTANVDTVVVTWTSTNATACSRDDSPLQTSGTETVGPFAAGTHPITIVCTGTGGSASATKDIISEAAPPTVSASLSATVVKAHVTTVDLTWNSTGTTWCERDGTALSGTSGSETGFGPFYEGSHSFTVTCGRDADTQTASATVTVRAAPPWPVRSTPRRRFAR